MQDFTKNKSATNFILDLLPQFEYESLHPHLVEVELSQSNILIEKGEPITNVYFPTTCILSWTNLTETGEVVEVGVTGNEGLSGTILLLGETIAPWQTEVQMAGRALKLPAAAFRAALDRSITLRQSTAAFIYFKMVQLNQAAVCNRFHSAEERLCRWLLAAQDHSQLSTFSFTREILAQMIGSGRPTVSLVTGSLQSAGLIHTNRGYVQILNRDGMESAACECYAIGKQALNHYRNRCQSAS